MSEESPWISGLETSGAGDSDRGAASLGRPGPTDEQEQASIGLQAALSHQQVVSAAVGVLVAQHGCSVHRAKGILVDRATRTDRSVLAEARRVIERSSRVVAAPEAPRAALADEAPTRASGPAAEAHRPATEP